MRKTILVAGGAGFIGSQINKMLDQQGYKTVVLDNLSTGNRESVTRGKFIEGDLADSKLLNDIFTTHSIDAVMHFAACLDVGESMVDPYKYYQNNVSNTLNLLNVMRHHSIKTLIFSSSAAIFGEPQEIPITEHHPTSPINPYGMSKLMVEKILSDFDQAYGFRSCCLRYFNAAGADPEGEIKHHKATENNLIPIVVQSLKMSRPITINGTDYPTPDGTCVRDYIHIADLGSAHILALEQLFNGAPSSAYNLGNGKGFSVREVLQTAEQVTGISPIITEGPRRPGDPPTLLASSEKAKEELRWSPKYPDLKTMIQHAWGATIGETKKVKG